MGRPPCCDKVGVKKGPWTPEEDIVLVSYVQEHGPGNWKAVPTTTGLKRCSKSCRLRWTNYLRPGIKRGSFTDQEERMIVQLQALLGNKWAAISSYLPERTDNDIKNYWNTHLKKKLKKLQSGSSDQSRADQKGFSTNSDSISRGQWERRLQADINTARQALTDALSFENTIHSPHEPPPLPSDNTKPGQGIYYASSTGNIARLLKEWVKVAPKSEASKCSSTQNSSNVVNMDSCSNCSEETPAPSIGSKAGIDLSESCQESLFGLDTYEASNSDRFSRSSDDSRKKIKSEPIALAPAPLSMLESWLLQDDHQGKDYVTHCTFDDNPELLII